MKKVNKNFIIGGSLLLLFLVESTSKVWDIASDIIMMISLLVVCLFIVVGIAQWVNRKSLKKVDKNIFVVAGLYVAVAIVFVLFEIVVINNRPVLENGELVVSFPSSHVLISLSLLLSGLIQLHKFYMKNRKVLLVADIVVSILAVMIVIGRMLSGVHWITDIIGAILVSGALVYIYNGVLEIIMNKNTKDKTLE